MRSSSMFSVCLVSLVFVSTVFAQTDSARGYNMGGLVIVPNPSNYEPMEVRLVTETETPMGQTLVRPAERFAFYNLPAGRYFVLMNVPGFKPVRQQVALNGFGSGLGGPIVLERAEERTPPKPLYLTGEHDLVDVTQLRRTSGKASKSPDSYEQHCVLAAAYRKSHNYADAENEYRAALSLRPRAVTPLIDLGSLYLEQIDNGIATPETALSLLDKAKKVLLQVVQTNSDASYAHFLLGVTYYKGKLNREAEASFRRALELEPRLGDARMGLLNVYIRTNDWPAVIAQIDLYLKENPNTPDRQLLLNKRSQVEKISQR
jgi:hypothetical protein